MDLLNSSQVYGDRVKLKRTDPRHFTIDGKNGPVEKKQGPSFKNAVANAINKTNDLQNESMDLNRKMVTEPDSVDPHDVTIAMAKANMSISMMKAVVDRGLKAYKEIINLR